MQICSANGQNPKRLQTFVEKFPVHLQGHECQSCMPPDKTPSPHVPSFTTPPLAAQRMPLQSAFGFDMLSVRWYNGFSPKLSECQPERWHAETSCSLPDIPGHCWPLQISSNIPYPSGSCARNRVMDTQRATKPTQNRTAVEKVKIHKGSW